MKKGRMLSTIFSILIGIFVFFAGMNTNTNAKPHKIYKVYLNGTTIGLINSKNELLDLIDNKQEEIKLKYKVDQVHPPKGLDIVEEFTYSNNISTSEEIYETIQGEDPFTISGYTITIKYPNTDGEKHIVDPSDADKVIIPRENITINVLKKEDFEEAFENVIKAFIGTVEYEQFIEDSQPEIIDTGSKIETIYWEEDITIKETLMDVDTFIFDNATDLSKYLLFGTTEKQKTYSVRAIDDIKSIAYNNSLSTEEFLIANPNFKSENALLTEGQIVNIGLIEPLVTITAEMHVVEDVVDRYQTEYVDDKDKYYGSEEVTQKGIDGTTRLTEKVLYRNGQIHDLVVIRELSEEITPVINEIVSRGVKSYTQTGGFEYYSGGTWAWPTINPSIITSRFGHRWGTHHNAIDISGTGHRSPIFSANDGVVVKSTYEGAFGYLLIINHENGYITLYAHLAEKPIHSVGQRVKRGELIGLMGNTGRSFGTHLHFSVIKDTEFRYANYIDPCVIYSC